MREKGQPGLDETAVALDKLVGGESIRLAFGRPGKMERDRFGRLLYCVLLPDGCCANV